MGADLIGYLVKGKVKLPPKSKAIAWFNKNQVDGKLIVSNEFEEEEEITKEAFVKFIDDFYDFWKSSSRDASSRIDPDDKTQQIVFAGDMSWGDEPDGYGYGLLKQLLECGVDEVLGIK
jgi:hypothetical protein